MWTWVLITGVLLQSEPGETTWGQFRGPNASGVSAAVRALPIQLNPTENLLWKTSLPAGHSSPVVSRDRVYLTAAQGQELFTIALDRVTGKELWRRAAPLRELEEVHSIGSHAQPSPVTDGQIVVSLFGSSGLSAYDRAGHRLWHLPLGPFKNNFGAGSSPIIVGDLVILNQDHDTDSFLLALDKRTGKARWRADRAEFPRGYATPVLWQVGGKTQIVVMGTLRAVGYDLETGKEIWTVRGLARIANMTPFTSDDGMLFLPAWAPGGDDTDRIDAEPFATLLNASDANKNGVLEENEVPTGPVKQRFNQIDRDKDGKITNHEYESMRNIFLSARNVLVAVKPGGIGDITKTHVVWSQNRNLPYVPSPVYYQGMIFMVKNGGIVSCIDAKTGQITKQGRIKATGDYYSSPVAGDGKIYLLSQRGEVTVLSAEAQWRELSRHALAERSHATPALVDGGIFLRTESHLYAFGMSKP